MRLRSFISAATTILAVSCSHTDRNRSMVVVNPVHYHAALVQKNALPGVSDTVDVYAPEGEELTSYLNTVRSFNERAENPTRWVERIHKCTDCIDSLREARDGDFVILACPNMIKANYILAFVKKGYNVLADKPLAITSDGFETLNEAYDIAKEKGLIIYDLMTERYDIINIIVRKLISDKNFIGKLQDGVSMSSVHHFYKNVVGSVLQRPKWYYDTRQQGEGIVDVTTHLIDLIFWQCFPEQSITRNDVNILSADHYPTHISLGQYKLSTGAESFPDYLDFCRSDSVINVMSNGSISFYVKGIPVTIDVRWDFEAPEGSGDTFEALYKGSKATIKIVQDSTTNFKKILTIDASREAVDDLKGMLAKDFTGIAIEEYKNGSWIVNINPAMSKWHEDHFGLVCKSFLEYLNGSVLPDWESTNTITKYHLTTEAVKLAQKQNE